MNKKIAWIDFGILLSIIWIAFTSFIYFDYLNNNDKSYNEKLKLNIHDFADHEEDIERRDEALEYADKHGNGAMARMYIDMGLKFHKPVFSPRKYFSLLFFPLFWIWLIIFFAQKGYRLNLGCSISIFLISILLSGTLTLFFFYSLICVVIKGIFFLKQREKA